MADADSMDLEARESGTQISDAATDWPKLHSNPGNAALVGTGVGETIVSVCVEVAA
jgi:hypothetical protein